MKNIQDATLKLIFLQTTDTKAIVSTLWKFHRQRAAKLTVNHSD